MSLLKFYAILPSVLLENFLFFLHLSKKFREQLVTKVILRKCTTSILQAIALFFLVQFKIFPDPTKIYLMELKSSETDIPKAREFRKSLQEAITISGTHSLIDEDTIRNFQEKLKKQQLLGCDETVCLTQIANALEAEELLTGEFQSLANQYRVSFKHTSRNPETFEVGIKTTFSITYFENQKSYYTKEIIRKIKNPLYTINTASAPPSGGNGTSSTKLSFLPPMEKISIPDIRKKNTAEDPSNENIFNDFIYDGTQFLISRNFKEAREKFQNGKNWAVAKKINPESLSLSYRMDLVQLLYLETKFSKIYEKLISNKIWRIEEIKSEFLPILNELALENPSTITSPEGKKIYSKLYERIISSYLLIFGEYLFLLYDTNKLEQFSSDFLTYEKYYIASSTYISGISQIDDKYKSHKEKSLIIEKEFLPAWNLEIEKNCVALYYAFKIFPAIQNKTRKEYSDSFIYLEELYRNTLNQMQDGRNVLSIRAKKSCEGVR